MYTTYENTLRDITRNRISFNHCCFLAKIYEHMKKYLLIQNNRIMILSLHQRIVDSRKSQEVSYNFEKKILHNYTFENLLDRCRLTLSKSELKLLHHAHKT